jgi:hypothetical protein
VSCLQAPSLARAFWSGAAARAKTAYSGITPEKNRR